MEKRKSKKTKEEMSRAQRQRFGLHKVSRETRKRMSVAQAKRRRRKSGGS